MTVNSDGSRSSVSSSIPRAILHHLDRVEIALAPEAIGVDRLVGQRQHVEQRVEMANGGVNVDRLDRIAAPEMDRIEALAETDEVLKVALVARPPPARAVERVGRARHRPERDVPPPIDEIARGVARMQREFLRREPDVRFDQRGIEANPVARPDRRRRRRPSASRAPRHAGSRCRSPSGPRARPDGSIRARRGRRGRAARTATAAGRLAARRRRRVQTARRRRRAPRILRRQVGRHSCSPGSCRGRVSTTALVAIGRARGSSGAAYTRLAPKWHCGMPIRAKAWRSRYFAARSFGASAAAGSGSGGRAAAPAENRAMSQERNNATASLLRSSGWVVR